MKSYFAKLAARATLPNASPSPSRATPAHDPFEDVSTINTLASPQHVSVSNRSPSDSNETSRLNAPLRTDETVRSNADGMDVRVRPDVESVSRRSTEPATIGEPFERVSRSFEETKSKSQGIPSPAEVVKLEPSVQAPPLLHEESAVQTSVPKIVAEKANESGDTEPLNVDERLNEIQAEQTALLRKADAFMNSLVDRRREPRVSAQDKEHSQQDSPRQTSIERQPETRLEPATKPRPQTDTSDEQPSLVIGNLTVEVMPPPAQPTRPAKQIVVVRGGESRRAAIVHSSQRFGLGQF